MAPERQQLGRLPSGSFLSRNLPVASQADRVIGDAGTGKIGATAAGQLLVSLVPMSVQLMTSMAPEFQLGRRARDRCRFSIRVE